MGKTWSKILQELVIPPDAGLHLSILTIQCPLPACASTNEPTQKLLSSLQVQCTLTFESVAAEVAAVAYPSHQGGSGVWGVHLWLFSVYSSRIPYLTLSAQFICLPLPPIYFSLVVSEHSVPMTQVIPKLSLITESIRVIQDALTLPDCSFPASFIPQL